MRRPAHECLAVVMWFCLTTGALGGDTASTSPPDLNSEQLTNMTLDDFLKITVTTTSKTEEKLVDAPGVISVVTRDEMNRFGARTLKDVLLRMPSINLSGNYMTDRSGVAIRGNQLSPASNHVLLLINGRPVREAEEGGIKSEFYESFPIASIDRIEIIRGPGSVLYGSNALSGIINVITKKPDENCSEVTVQGGVPREIRGTANGAYRIGNIGLVFGGTYNNTKNWDVRFQADDTVFRNFSIPDKGYGAYVELNYKQLRVMSSYDNWLNYFALQKYIPAVYPNVPQDAVGRHTFGEVRWDKWFNDVGFHPHINEYWDMTFNATYTQSWLKVDSFPAPHRNSFDLTGEWTNFLHPAENLNFTIGILGNRAQGTQVSGLPPDTTIDTSQNSFSGYAQGDYRIISQVKILAGLQANKAAGFDIDLNPRMGLIWSPQELVNVKALYSSAFRAPTIQERYLNSRTLKGSSALKPEKIRTIDLGVNIQSEEFSFGINHFYSTITNSIYQKQNFPPPSVYLNSDIPTTISGVEVEGKFYITKELLLTASGLYQKNTTGDSAGNLMPVPETSAKGGISYSSNGLTASVFNIYEGHLDKRYDATFNHTRKAFNLLNATLHYEISRLFKLSTPVLSLDIDGYNLLNEEVWLPATGQSTRFTLPAIKGASVCFGVTVGF